MIRLILSLFTLMSLTGCGMAQTLLSGAEPEIIHVDERTLIFNAAATARLTVDDLLWIYGADIDDTWTPTQADIDAMKAALPAFLRAERANYPQDDPRIPNILAALDTYYVQYFGLVIEGERRIYGNFACEIHDGWQDTLWIVTDGGECFFETWYNPATGTFIRLYVNGYA